MESFVTIEAEPSLAGARRGWVPPVLELHSGMTEVTKAPMPVPMNLLFLQASISQCFDANHNPVDWPTG
mgnify:CR=1 FL=1